jgi:pimeloyl-ACP methyl ester carboxylesterase
VTGPGRGPQSVPDLPDGRTVELPGRGSTFVRECAGPPGAPTVLLLHGWTVNADVAWYPTFDRAGRHYRVVAPDLRGHGRGVRPPDGRVRLVDAADDVAALCAELGVDRALVVGYSMGGAVAQLLWRRHPRLVGGLVLCSTAMHFRGGAVSAALVHVQAGLARVLRASPPVSRWATARMADGKVGHGRHAEWLRRELLRGEADLLLSAGAGIGRFDSSTWIGRLDVPAAVIVTTRDLTVPTGRQRELAAALPGARVWEVDGPHNAAVTVADQWVPTLLDALAGIGERPPLTAEPAEGTGDS